MRRKRISWMRICSKELLLLKSYDILCNIRRCMLVKGLWHFGKVLMFLSILRLLIDCCILKMMGCGSRMKLSLNTYIFLATYSSLYLTLNLKIDKVFVTVLKKFNLSFKKPLKIKINVHKINQLLNFEKPFKIQKTCS